MRAFGDESRRYRLRFSFGLDELELTTAGGGHAAPLRPRAAAAWLRDHGDVGPANARLVPIYRQICDELGCAARAARPEDLLRAVCAAIEEGRLVAHARRATFAGVPLVPPLMPPPEPPPPEPPAPHAPAERTLHLHTLHLIVRAPSGDAVDAPHGLSVVHPGGGVERVPLREGCFRRAGVAPGAYRVTLATLRVAWGAPRARAGDDIELRATTAGIDDGGRVTFLVRRAFADASVPPVARVEGDLAGGVATGRWRTIRGDDHHRDDGGGNGAASTRERFQLEAWLGESRALSGVLEVETW